MKATKSEAIVLPKMKPSRTSARWFVMILLLGTGLKVPKRLNGELIWLALNSPTSISSWDVVLPGLYHHVCFSVNVAHKRGWPRNISTHKGHTSENLSPLKLLTRQSAFSF
ncbi:hypothetical protein FXO37_13163 [Capsicum annuum]|nr:hypothetical protein FXO37_13163 [Capsicum annuum]